MFILEAVAREPKHGYALIRELEGVFGEPPNRNQVYPLLNRLEKEGYLRADRSEGRGKTRYQLTGKGLELLKGYRLRTPAFRERARGLWGEGETESSAGGPHEGPSGPVSPGAGPEPPSLLEPLRIGGDPLRGPSARHAGEACRAEVVVRRRVGGDAMAVEVLGLDPACSSCQEVLATLRAVRDRWL